MKVVVATGEGFDPLHERHIRWFKEAKQSGDILIVMLKSDEQLIKKKGKTFYLSQLECKERDELFINSKEPQVRLQYRR
jgi:cytidyltransferase-like protein